MKQIVILGAGFGGLQVARRLGRFLKNRKLTEAYKVILVDKNSYHTFHPTLYEIATTSDYVASNSQLKRIVAFNVKEILNGLPVEFVHAEVAQIDPANMEIKLATGTVINYNWLVLALGSEPNFFGIEGLAQHALPFKTFADALRVREAIIEKVEGSELNPALCENARVIIGGGGATGVELSGEIKNLLNELPRVSTNQCKTSVTIIEGSPTILGPFSPKIIKRAGERLKKVGVEMLTGERIQSVSENELSLQSGKKIPYDILIWTGGVMPNHLMSTLRMKKDQSGARIIASPEMVCLPESEDLKITGKIYGIGDAICFMDPKTNKPVPGVARAAISQGWTAAYNISQEILAEQDLIHTVKMKHYHPMRYPYILPVGGKFAIAQFGPVIFSGIIAWIVKGLVEGNYLFSIFKPTRAFYYWVKGIWIFMRNDRLG